MKIIEPFKTWKNGTEKNAIYFLNPAAVFESQSGVSIADS
jgi:hypothetical protein